MSTDGVVDRAEDSDVDFAEVEDFLTSRGLWDRLA